MDYDTSVASIDDVKDDGMEEVVSNSDASAKGNAALRMAVSAFASTSGTSNNGAVRRRSIAASQGAGGGFTFEQVMQAKRLGKRLAAIRSRRGRASRTPTKAPTAKEPTQNSDNNNMIYYDDEEDWEYNEEEEIPAERELAEDAAWKLIQKNTFCRWANEHLKQAGRHIEDLGDDLGDGLNLIALVEVLSGKKIRHNKRPAFRTQKLENVTMALRFLEEDEGIKLVNIDSTDIVEGRLKLILGLIWTLILHYSISMPMWEGEDQMVPNQEKATAKQKLMNWVQNKLPDLGIRNFTTDWNDGTRIGALVDAVGPGLCPDWDSWDPNQGLRNATEAMDLAEEWLEVPQLIKPEEMTNPKVDELSMMTYLSQFPSAKLRDGAPLRPKKNPNRVRAYGPGLQPTGNHKGQPASFTVETYAAGQGDIEVIVLNPRGQTETCEIYFNNDERVTYSCTYVPAMEGSYRIIVKFSGQEIPRSPFNVQIAGPAGDPSKCRAQGPGIQRSGNVKGKATHFEVFTQDAGSGELGVYIVDQRGRRDYIKPAISHLPDNIYYVEYTPREEGMHQVVVLFAGGPIPGSPFAVHVEPACNARMCYAQGRGVQARGIRENDICPFKVMTQNAGPGELSVELLGPDDQKVPVTVKQLDGNTFECVYTPSRQGNYTLNIKYGDQHITKSPFQIEVGPYKESRVVAFGPGLEGGVCGYSADFTVETNGEAGALGFSIEGPSQAKIDCRDNYDGSADVAYWPTAPGEYAVHILCNDEDIPNSPYMASIRPATSEFDPRKVSASGPGLERTGVVMESWAEFTIDCRHAGKAPLNVTCMDAEYNPIEVQVQDRRNGTYACRYMPHKSQRHLVMISYGGCNIPHSPFRVNVSEPSDPTKVRVYGPAVDAGAKVETFSPTNFTVDCRDAGPGDVAIALTDERGLDVPVDTEDNQDGTFSIRFQPQSVGDYTASIFFADQEIPKSPFKINVQPSIDVNKVVVEGLEPNCQVYDENEFEIITVGAGRAQSTVNIVTPSGRRVMGQVEPTIDGYLCRYQLTEPGAHDFHVTFGGQPIRDSPFRVNAHQPIVEEEPVIEQMAKAPVQQQLSSPGGDASKVKAWGNGLFSGVAGRSCEFNIDTRGAGAGGLGLSVEGPSEAKLECMDNGDGTCRVIYLPMEPGQYTISITFADEPIPESPFSPLIQPSKQVDVRGIRVYGPGIQPEGVFMDSITDFVVDARSINKTGEGRVKAVINNPSGTRSNTFVKSLDDGTYQVSYTPFEEGQHSIEVTYEGIPVPRSPFSVHVVPGNDPSRVKAYGPGLQGGFTNQSQQFTINTRGAGMGGLGLAIEGPCEAEMKCQDNRDGTCTVEYLPTKAGDYDISVKFADTHIPGSPFPVQIIDPVDPSKVRCYGDGLKEVMAGQPANFVVDCSDSGQANVEVIYTDPTGAQKPAELRPRGDGTYACTYFPLTEGTGKIDVRFANQHVPGSPFSARIAPLFDPNKVRVSGDGVSSQGVLASIPVTFSIDTREAGFANVDVAIQDPSGRYLTPIIRDRGDGTFDVTYTPEDIGRYGISVNFGGQPLPDSPFNVYASPTGDASKCIITEGLVKEIMIDEESMITVDAAESGRGKVTCRIRTPTGSDADIDIADNGDGTFSIFYTPKKAGAHTVELKFGGQPIPNGHFTQQSVTYKVDRSDPSKLALPDFHQATDTPSSAPITEDLMDAGRVSRDQAAPVSGVQPQQPYYPAEFSIPAGPVFNFVDAEIETPSNERHRPELTDNHDGSVRVRYQPQQAGSHKLHIRYNEQPCQGSPFVFHVEPKGSGKVLAYGPGLSHGIAGQPCRFTIVTKEAGAGGLQLAVEGPSKAEIECKDNKDGTCDVSFLPTAPGDYKIVVTFEGRDIAGSPFLSRVTSDPRKRSQVTLGAANEISLRVAEHDIGQLQALIESPSGHEEPCMLKCLANGHLGISFTPRELGQHLVSVFRDGKHIANSPFRINVSDSEIGNAGRVRVYGAGLKSGECRQQNEFIVDTRNAGYGGLTISIEGPSKAEINCQDMDDGTCKVVYVPTEPGSYLVNVKYTDEHVPGSPFNVQIGGKPSGRQVEQLYRQPAMAHDTSVGSQCELSLKIPGTTLREMDATVTSPSGATEACDITDLEDSHYSIKFVPKEMGKHSVSVKHRGLHIPGSPFQFTVGPITDGGSHKVQASGPGLMSGEVNQPCFFNIFTREAGAGALSIAVEGPSKAEIEFKDRKDGSCGVSYVCTQPGDYVVSIKFCDQHIPDSPFRVQINPSSGDARKVSVQSLAQKGLQVGKPATFGVKFNGAMGRLSARVVAPSGAIEDAYIQELEQGDYAVRFIPKENGSHYVHVLFNGQDIPHSPFRVLVGKVDADPGKVIASGDGLRRGVTGQPCRFFVSTVDAGSGILSVTVEGPSKVQLQCQEQPTGYEFQYSPTAPGDYMITIRYAGPSHVPGSPFKAKISGNVRQQSKTTEQSSFTVETVEKSSTAAQSMAVPQAVPQTVPSPRSAQPSQASPTSPTTGFSDASRVHCQGIGLQQAFVGKKALFSVDASGAGDNMLLVGMKRFGGPAAGAVVCEEMLVKNTSPTTYQVTYELREPGSYLLVVKWGDEHVPGSPFRVQAT